MTVIGLADGPHEVPDELARDVAAVQVRTPFAEPGWRPLLSGEAALRFGITPVPVSDEPAAKAAAVARRVARKLLRAPDMGGGGGGAYLRSKGLWNDPGSGKFARIGWSTAKAKQLNDRELLSDIIEDALRSHKDGVWVQLRTNKLASAGSRKGDWVVAKLTEQGITVEPGVGLGRFIMYPGDFDDVDVRVDESWRPEKPAPAFEFDPEQLEVWLRDGGLGGAFDDIKVLSDDHRYEWNDRWFRWDQTRSVEVSATYRGYDVLVQLDASNSDVDTDIGWRWTAVSPDGKELGGTYQPLAVGMNMGLEHRFADAFSTARDAINDAEFIMPPSGEGVLTAEDLYDDDGEEMVPLQKFLGALDRGPGWPGRGWREELEGDDAAEPTMSDADIDTVVRYRAKVTAYGQLIRSGVEAAAALAAVQESDVGDLIGPGTRQQWVLSSWRQVIDGRGYLSANLRALRGEEGFGEPDPDAMRFMQLMREDFLAKVPDTPAQKLRVYRASNSEDPWGGNDPTNFGADRPRKPSSGVTSWAFTQAADAKRDLSHYGDHLHGIDVPFDQIIGRFGSVRGELLAAEDPAIVEAIENWRPMSAVERATELLAGLPDDPFAVQPSRASAAQRIELAQRIDTMAFGLDNDQLRGRFPQLDNEGAAKLVLYGGVRDGVEDPWEGREALRDAPYERALGLAVDTLLGADKEAAPGDVLIRLGKMVRRLDPNDSPDAEVLLDPTDPTTHPTLGIFDRALDRVQGWGLVDTDELLTDSDREALDKITEAGRVLLADLRSSVRSVAGPELDAMPSYYGDRELTRLSQLQAEGQVNYEQNLDKARRLTEEHAEEWLDILGPAEPSLNPEWPVGPFTWDPMENGLIDLKEPRFTDAKGRRFRLMARSRPGSERVDYWDLSSLGNPTADLPGPIDPPAVAADVKNWDNPDPEAVELAARLTETFDAIEAARVGWWQAKNAEEEAVDVALIRDYTLHPNDTIGRVDQLIDDDVKFAANQWFRALHDDLVDTDDVRAAYFRYEREAFPADYDANEVKEMGDLMVADVVAAIAERRLNVGDPYVPREGRLLGAVELPLVGDLNVLGFDHGRVYLQPQPNGRIDVSLRMYSDGDDEFPTVVHQWDDRTLSINPSKAVRALRAMDRQRNRLIERRREARKGAVRDWAATTLNATTEPKIAPGSSPSKAEQMVRSTTPFIPDSLKLSVPPVTVRNVEPDRHFTGRSYYRDNATFMDDRAGDDTYLHEYGHHIERIGPLGRAVWAFYLHRTGNEVALPLSGLTGDNGYKPYEMARPDEFFHPYAGKDYGATRRRSAAGRSELFTLGLEGVFYNETGPKGDTIDDEYAAFILGTLLHFGRRAERYYPDLVEGGETGDVPASIKDLDDLLQERAERTPRRRRSRSHFGRIVSGGRTVFGGDADNPFIVEDELLDRDNPLGSPAPTVTPDPVAVAAASQLTRRSVERAARGDAEPSQALREVIQRSQQALREQGIETVTLYRGAREGEDPFRPSSSGLIEARRPGSITSWTSSPERASSFADTPGLTVHRAEVPVSQIVSYDLVGQHSTAQGWRAGADLSGGEVLVAADPGVVERLLGGRVTPDATMEGDGAAAPTPA